MCAVIPPPQIGAHLGRAWTAQNGGPTGRYVNVEQLRDKLTNAGDVHATE